MADVLNKIPIAVLISAGAEWRAVLSYYHPACQPTPYGDYFLSRIAGQPVVFLHGGWGKIAAAGSTLARSAHAGPSRPALRVSHCRALARHPSLPRS